MEHLKDILKEKLGKKDFISSQSGLQIQISVINTQELREYTNIRANKNWEEWRKECSNKK